MIDLIGLHDIVWLVLTSTLLAAVGLVLGKVSSRNAALRKQVLSTTMLGLALLPALMIVFFFSGPLWSWDLPGWSQLEAKLSVVHSPTASLTDPVADPPTSVDLEASAISPTPLGTDKTALALTPSVPTLPMPASSGRMLALGIFCLWFSGLLIQLVGIMRAQWKLNKLVKNARQASVDEQQRLDGVLQGCWKGPLPDVLWTGDLATPVAVGYWRPRLLLPAQLGLPIHSPPMRHALVHELAHLKERDHRQLWYRTLLVAFYWPHPLVHWINRCLDRACEEVCDNHVLDVVGRKSYAETLLAFAELRTEHTTQPLTTGFLSSKWSFEERIRGLLDKRRSTMVSVRKSTTIVGWILILGSTVLAAGGSLAARGQEKETQGRRKTERNQNAVEQRKSAKVDLSKISTERLQLELSLRKLGIQNRIDTSVMLVEIDDVLREAAERVNLTELEYTDLNRLIDKSMRTYDDVIEAAQQSNSRTARRATDKLQDLWNKQQNNLAVLRGLQKRKDLTATERRVIQQLIDKQKRGQLSLVVRQVFEPLPNQSSSWTKLYRRKSLGPDHMAMIHAAIDSPFPVQFDDEKEPRFSIQLTEGSDAKLKGRIDVPGAERFVDIELIRDQPLPIQINGQSFRISYNSTYIHRASKRKTRKAHLIITAQRK